MRELSKGTEDYIWIAAMYVLYLFNATYYQTPLVWINELKLDVFSIMNRYSPPIFQTLENFIPNLDGKVKMNISTQSNEV